MSWVLVTGAARRLGAEICRTLAKSGYSIVVHYRKNQREAEAVRQECEHLGVQAKTLAGDFSTPDFTERFIEAYLKEFSNTTALINNVGNYLIKSALNTSVYEWSDLFQTNLTAPFMLTKALVPSLKKSRGSIINIGVAGVLQVRAEKYSTAYSITKSALWMLTRTLAAELASFDIRVNMVSPGYLENAVDLPVDLSQLPMKRAASCHEVAHLIDFLLDTNNRYITGQNIEIAGGHRL